MEITETMFKAAAEAMLPKFIMWGKLPYRMDAHGLMGGSWRISYCNGHLDENDRMALDESWEDPFDCLKVMHHYVSRCLSLREITEQEFNSATLPYNKYARLKEVATT